MAKERATVGTDGRALPVLPPDRDVRAWAKLVRVMFYTPGFLALLLIKSGEPAGFGITVELLMLSSAAAVVAGLFVGSQSVGGGGDTSSRVGVWSASLVMELLCAVPFLSAVPPMFRQLANSTLLNTRVPEVDLTLGASELLPAVAILPFMVYQLAGFGTLYYVVPKAVNWAINLSVLALIVASSAANLANNFRLEQFIVAFLVGIMAITMFYGIMKLRRMQAAFDANCPPQKEKKDKKAREEQHPAQG